MSISLILGDVHIGKGLSVGRPALGTALNSRIVDQINILDWALVEAVQRDAERIIITGDIFEDSKPHPTLIKIFLSWLGRCEANDIAVHILHGNHDIIRSGQFTNSALDIIAEANLKNIFVYSGIDTIYADGVCFTLLPFRDRRSFDVDTHEEAIDILCDKLRFESADIPTGFRKVLIGHLTIEGSIYVGDEIDDASNELFCPVSMFKDYDYVWMGHVHKPQVLKNSNPRVAHIGSMDRSDLGESDHDKIIVIFDSTEIVPFVEVVIPTRPLESLTISVPPATVDTTKYVIDTIAKDTRTFKKAIVRVEIQLMSGELLSVNRKMIEEKIYELGAFHINSFSEVKKIALIRKKADTISGVMSESTAIRTYGKEFIEDDIRDQFIALAEECRKELQATDKQ